MVWPYSKNLWYTKPLQSNSVLSINFTDNRPHLTYFFRPWKYMMPALGRLSPSFDTSSVNPLLSPCFTLSKSVTATFKISKTLTAPYSILIVKLYTNFLVHYLKKCKMLIVPEYLYNFHCWEWNKLPKWLPMHRYFKDKSTTTTKKSGKWDLYITRHSNIS